jgi:O-antigen/teichoic acid export membrane protein
LRQLPLMHSEASFRITLSHCMNINLLQKLKNKHFLSLAGNGIMSVLGMLNMIILYRALSVANIGMWVFFLSILLLVDTFRSGFLTTAFIKFYAGAPEARRAEVIGSAWFVAGCITGILLLLNVLAYPFISYIENPSLAFFAEWFGIIYVASLPSFLASCVVQAEQRFDHLLYIRFSSQGIFILLVAMLAFTGTATLQKIIYAYLGGAVITSLFTLVMGWSRINTFKNRSTACIKELYHFGKFSVGTTLSANLFGTSNTMIINFMLGPAALAVYNLGQRLMEIVEIPLRSFAATGMPELSAAYNANDNKQVIETMKKYIGLITLAIAPACLMAVALADVAIQIIGGDKYTDSEAANIMRILMLLALFYPLDRFMALTLDVIHQPQLNFVKVLIMLAVSVTASFVGILLTGNIYGVALGGVMPTLAGIGIAYWGLQRYYPFQITSIYKVGYLHSKVWVKGYWGKVFGTRQG